MKKLIAVLSVALVLVFSCVLTSFADDSVVNGYAVDDVPYNEAFDGVLTASDNGSQLYSASNNKTYNSSSVLSAPATSSSAVYTAKSITDFLPLACYGSANKYTRSVVSSNGYSGINFVWEQASKTNNVYTVTRFAKSFYGILKPSRKYRVTFTIDIKNASVGQFNFNLVDTSANNNVIVRLFSREVVEGTGASLSGQQSVSIDVVMPDDIGTLAASVSATVVRPESFSFYINDFTITDITSEDLDKSLDKLGDKIDSSINPSVPYEKWDNGDLKDSKDKLDSAMGELPTVDINAVKELKDSIDISSYSNAFAAINQLFIRVVDTIGVTPLIFFALFFGICIFLIGRKLSGG